MDPKTAVIDLLAHGWTEVALAERIGTTQPTINRIKHGKSPIYETGARLVELAHKELAGRGNRKKRALAS